MLVGMKVVPVGDTKLRFWQVLVRNILKLVVLIMPPLVIFVLLNPYRQHLADIVARTIVVVEYTTEEGEEQSDSGEDQSDDDVS